MAPFEIDIETGQRAEAAISVHFSRQAGILRCAWSRQESDATWLIEFDRPLAERAA
jgi:hypothetical protein